MPATETKRLLTTWPKLGDRIRFRAEGGAKYWGWVADLCHCPPCDAGTYLEHRWVLHLETDWGVALLEHVPRSRFTPDRRKECHR